MFIPSAAPPLPGVFLHVHFPSPTKRDVCMTPHLSFAVAVALSLTAQNAHAQAGATTTLPTVVVTAQRDSESLTVPTVDQARLEANTQPGGTAIIDAEQYKRGRATNLKDALDFAPGVF